VDERTFRCGACGAAFACEGGIYRFLLPRAQDAKAAFLAQYRRVRAQDGCGSYAPEARRALPEVPATDPHADEWRIRARSVSTLLGLIPRSGAAAARVLDAGAGNAWLSNRIAADGHDVVAIDVSDDERDGLGACSAYAARICAVQGDFETMPFAPGQFDTIVFNASLHYAARPADVLHHARALLREGGILAVMDSPMFADAGDGRSMVERESTSMKERFALDRVELPGRGFLTFSELDRAACDGRLRSTFVRSRGSLGWEARRLWGGRRLGRAPAAFGVWIAR
jgi:SAM-dependent methyltransferase